MINIVIDQTWTMQRTRIRRRRESTVRRLCLTALIAILALTGRTMAGTVGFVDSTARKGGDGLSWDTAFNDVQDALDAAAEADSPFTEIWVAKGTYHPDRGTGDRDISFALQTGLAVYGGFNGDEMDLKERDPVLNATTLSADLENDDDPDAGLLDPTVFDNSYHVVVAIDVDATAVLDGFVILGGTAHGAPSPRNLAGGLLCLNAAPTINNCRFLDNKAIQGGAAHIDLLGRPSFTNCEFRESFSNSSGGAVFGVATFSQCLFHENVCESRGGAVSGEIAGTQEFFDCEFVSNNCRVDGGAVIAERAIFVDCTFLGNIAGVDGDTVSTSGGAVDVEQDVILIRCHFEANTTLTHTGGAVSANDVLALDSAFIGNTAVSGVGGAISGSVTAINCDFEANAAVQGGAIFGPKLLISCSFVGNSVTEEGGALWNSGGAITATNCSFFGNVAGVAGGAVYGESDDLEGVFTNCVFAGNTAGIHGGAIYNSIGLPKLLLLNCTAYGNAASDAGGGVYNDFGELTIANSVLWSNEDGAHGTAEEAQIFVGRDGLIDLSYSCIENLTGQLRGLGNIADDPLLADPGGVDGVVGTADDDLRLSAGSPCIDSADNTILSACVLDLDANLRRFDDPATRDHGVGRRPVVDMGAFEFLSNAGDDCNGNALYDPCELAEGFTPDCNGNGLPDDCDVAFGASADCNVNGVPDECELDDFDCNGNDIPDDCDIMSGFSADCNGNGIPDECDTAGGFSDDCNDNGIPDECEVDCNFNGVPDDCDIAVQSSSDCDRDGIPDECAGWFFDCDSDGISNLCEIDGGRAEDCNENGRPDECDLSGAILIDSGPLTPIGGESPQSITVPSPPLAASNVLFALRAVADLDANSEEIEVFVNGLHIGTAYDVSLDHCPEIPEEAEFLMTADAFNDAIRLGELIVDLIPSNDVNHTNCENRSYIRFTVSYQAVEQADDDNGDGIPDECGILGDLNSDGRVDATDLLILLGSWGACPRPPAQCPADLNRDGLVGTTDLLALLANWG